jgi:hypothetical protein
VIRATQYYGAQGNFGTSQKEMLKQEYTQNHAMSAWNETKFFSRKMNVLEKMLQLTIKMNPISSSFMVVHQFD